MNRSEFISLAEALYGETPERPFEKDQNTVVFRHSCNRKWFALVMTIPKMRLGSKEVGMIDVVNVKCSPEIIDSFRHERGIYPAYHMNKTHWLTIALDGSAENEKIRFLLGVSHELTRKKIRGRRSSENNGE